MKEYIEERALAVAGYIIESNATVRQAARKVLDINKSERHIRGGMATKEKYEHEHLLHACQRAVS